MELDCYNEKSVYDIPAYFTDMLDEAKAKYIGKKLLISGSEYSITDVILEPKFFEEINDQYGLYLCVYRQEWK